MALRSAKKGYTFAIGKYRFHQESNGLPTAVVNDEQFKEAVAAMIATKLAG